MSILYIHGFASCGAGNKVHALQKQFGEANVISPHLSPEPRQAIGQLEEIINSQSIKLLVGSSLGGYYAEYLQGWFKIPAVLINPSTRPFSTLKKYTGMNKNWCTGEEFEWKEEYVAQLLELKRDAPAADEHYLVLLQTEDEVIDYRYAESRYEKFRVILEDGGNHRFENLHEYTQRIADFLEEVGRG